MTRKIVDLAQAPTLGSLYAKALGTKVKAFVPGHMAPMLVLPEVSHRVASLIADRDQLVAYQRLMGDTVREELPSVFIHGLAFPVAMSVMVRDDFPLPLMGMVHLANAVEHFSPIAPSSELEVSAYARDLREHRAGTQVDIVAEVFGNGGLLWRGVSTYLARGVWLGSRPEQTAVVHEAFVPPLRTGSWALGADTGRAYASVMGDYNPIHLSALSAKALGMRRAIAHGMYLAGRALASAAPHGVGYSWDIEFATPVFLPTRVDVSVNDDGESRTFSGWGAKNGKPHFSGSVRLSAPELNSAILP